MSNIEAAARVGTQPDWHRSADVVVVGLGMAGTCAALEAHRAGADVLVIERASGGGGASATSEGIFYLGGGTALQTECGYRDDPEEMFKFMRASTSTSDARDCARSATAVLNTSPGWKPKACRFSAEASRARRCRCGRARGS